MIFVVQIRSVQLYYFTVIIVIVIFIKDALIPEEVCTGMIFWDMSSFSSMSIFNVTLYISMLMFRL